MNLPARIGVFVAIVGGSVAVASTVLAVRTECAGLGFPLSASVGAIIDCADQNTLIGCGFILGFGVLYAAIFTGWDVGPPDWAVGLSASTIASIVSLPLSQRSG